MPDKNYSAGDMKSPSAGFPQALSLPATWVATAPAAHDDDCSRERTEKPLVEGVALDDNCFDLSESFLLAFEGQHGPYD